MKVNGYRFPVWLVAFIGVSLLLAVLSLYMVGLVVANQPDYAVNPVEFGSDIYYPADSEYCDGDMLTADFEFRVLKPRSVLMRVETWATAGGRTLIQEEHPQYVITEKNTDWQSFTLEKEVPDLAAGDYSYLVAIFTPPSARNPAFFEVPFAIAEGCN